jgi:hypothetical protein
VRRTVDIIYEALEASILWAMDRNIGSTLLGDIQNRVNSFLSNLTIKGALLGGQCWIDPEENTIEQLTQGQAVVSFDLEPPVAMERLTFKAYRNNGYYTTIFNQ